MIDSLTYVDCEGTGTSPTADRIVEICIHHPGEPIISTRVNPGVPIPAEATAVHGITDEMVATAPRFAELAPFIQATLCKSDVVLCGYSIRKYDSILIDTELRRAGQRGFPVSADGRLNVREIDLYQLWQRSEPRTLAGAAKRFVGVDLADAHTAQADTLILPGVLSGLIRSYGLSEDVEALCALSVPDGEVDRDGKFKRREDGVIVFNFGQKRGTPVLDEPGLLEWILGRDFADETKAWAEKFIDEYNASLEEALLEEMELPF